MRMASLLGAWPRKVERLSEPQLQRSDIGLLQPTQFAMEHVQQIDGRSQCQQSALSRPPATLAATHLCWARPADGLQRPHGVDWKSVKRRHMSLMIDSKRVHVSNPEAWPTSHSVNTHECLLCMRRLCSMQACVPFNCCCKWTWMPRVFPNLFAGTSAPLASGCFVAHCSAAMRCVSCARRISCRVLFATDVCCAASAFVYFDCTLWMVCAMSQTSRYHT